MPKHPQVSATTESLAAYVFSAQRRKATAATATGPMHRLHIGDTWLDPLPEARCEAQTLTTHPRLHTYAPVQGLDVLLDAIIDKMARRSGVTVPKACVQVTTGCTGAMAVACRALLEPGDQVLMPSPYWPLIRGIIGSVGAELCEVPFYTRLDASDFDAEAALEAAVTPRTTAIYVNSPNNPSGAILDDATAAAVARVANRHGLWILCDEVYEDLYFTDEAPIPLWTRPDMAERAIVGHSLSKAYAMAGARVGWAHGPEAAMRAVRAMQTFHTYCAPRPMQEAGARALTLGDQWLVNTRAIYRAAADRAADALGLPRPPGGTFLFWDVTPWLDGGDTLDFLDRCREAGVTLTPGAASGEDFKQWVRLSFTAVPPDDLDDALQRLQRVMGRR
jgi:N-succinyldiaminopimelate aminotransferase